MTFQRIHEYLNQWWFWGESDSNRIGPYNSRAEASQAMIEYAKTI